MGLSVASTTNGLGSGRVTPSTLTWPSAMASSSAAWVLGGVRLISSASSRPVNTGPGRKAGSPVARSSTIAPVRSAGSMSGVNWTRVNSSPSTVANVRASSVLPSPGRSSIRMWPEASTPSRTVVMASRLPTMTCSTSPRIRSHSRAVSATVPASTSVTVPPAG